VTPKPISAARWSIARAISPKRALENYDQVIRLAPELPVGHFGRGSLHMERQQWKLAIADFSEAIRLDPSHALAYSHRGYAP
jgi:tetratricopeptide (TPR) repeat protein